MWVGILLVVLIVIGYMVAILKKSKYVDGAAIEINKPAPKKKESLEKQPFPQQSKPQIIYPSINLDELADKIVDKLGSNQSISSSAAAKNIDKDTSSLIQIDESVIDLGTDISDLEGDNLNTKEEEKIDDLGEAKAKLSELLRKRKQSR